MRERRILYFSASRKNVEDFNTWLEKEVRREAVKWTEANCLDPLFSDLPIVISKEECKDSLCVIIDYLSLIKGLDRDNYEDVTRLVRRTIIQYPEVYFLFDQSNVKDDQLSGIEFVLGENRSGNTASEVAQGFHIFRKNDVSMLTALDYDNIFDGSNLRWAVKKKYYGDLELKNEGGNFEKLQSKRKENLAVVVDDEPRQSRFNGFALYSSGYRVMLVRTARMLLNLSDCVNQGLLRPKIIVRDFDLQFSDVRKKQDYVKNDILFKNDYLFKNVLLWDENWNLRNKDVTINLSHYIGKKKEGFGQIEANMIDVIRNYRFFSKEDDAECRWKIGAYNPFWCEKMMGIPIFVITNGHDFLRIKHTKYLNWQVKGDWLEVQGIEKPVSGLFHPFFTKLRDKSGKFIVKKQFEDTRYNTCDDGVKYGINKKRDKHKHGVPVDIYDTVCEMQRRAEEYYDKSHFVKSAVLAQEIIELLNGFHYQMMIKAYQLKAKAENAISMDVVGADEKQLVLDAEDRINIIKEDVLRMIYPLNDEEKQDFFKDVIIQYHHHKKERELLEHIFSECRDTCRNNEYFDVEAVFVREMAHLDQRALGIKDCISYCKHRIFIKRISDNYKKGL